MSAIKELRIEKGLTQKQAADLVGISIRSYKSYENESSKEGTLKYNYIFGKLQKTNVIDEENGVLDIYTITEKCKRVFEEYSVQYCILFGSYAKGKANGTSDVDMLIASDVKGLRFFGMVEKLRISLKKKVDVLNLEQLQNNKELLNEILKDGIRIYG